MRKFAYFLAILLLASLPMPFARACCDVEYKEIMAICNTEQWARGISQADAEKSCKCEIDVVNKRVKEDLIILYVAIMKNDDNALRTIDAEKGSKWVANGIAELMKVALEIGNTCNIK